MPVQFLFARNRAFIEKNETLYKGIQKNKPTKRVHKKTTRIKNEPQSKTITPNQKLHKVRLTDALKVIIFSFSRKIEHDGDEESLELEGDIDGGLALRRKIYISKEDAKALQINSSIVAVKVGAGSGGFSRFAPNITISSTFSLIAENLDVWRLSSLKT